MVLWTAIFIWVYFWMFLNNSPATLTTHQNNPTADLARPWPSRLCHSFHTRYCPYRRYVLSNFIHLEDLTSPWSTHWGGAWSTWWGSSGWCRWEPWCRNSWCRPNVTVCCCRNSRRSEIIVFITSYIPFYHPNIAKKMPLINHVNKNRELI